MKKTLAILIVLVSLLMSWACNQTKPSPEFIADAIYYNGDIITMEGDSANYAQAVAVKEGKILFVGAKEDAEKMKGDSTNMIDLQGKVLLPGFIDGHCHFGGFSSQAAGAQILPPPDAGVKNIPDLIQTLKAWATPENISLSGWIFGMGYDESVLEEKRHPTKQELDQVSTEIPIMIIHISGHFCVVNSKGLEILGITAKSKNPSGGIIRRMPNSNEPNGVLEELAAIPHFAKALTPSTPEGFSKFMQAGQNMALSYGYTTAQEGRLMGKDDVMAMLAASNFFKIDVVSYVDYSSSQHMYTKWNSSAYTNHYRIGGMKLTLDGSPQGRTAWRTVPYLLPPPGESKTYKGYPAIANDKDVAAIYDSAFKNNWQILTHANGDAAIDQMIRTMKPAAEKYGNKNRRNVLIHGQYVRSDQLDSLKQLDVIASLFPLHTFYWGDWHKELIGDSLGNRISPTRTALNKGLRITTQTDAPVALPSLMRVIWTAVSRTSRSGKVIGEAESLTPYEALKSITDWSAYQHFEEEKKGTLTKGKFADMVILDNNPLKVSKEAIKDIMVLETIKEGKTVYKR